MTDIRKRTRFEQLKEILRDPERKSIMLMAYELFYLTLLHKELPVHYFSRYLFKNGTSNIKEYLPNKLIRDITPRFNNSKQKEVLDNKLYFNLFYNQFNISLPKIVMYNHKHKFVTGNVTTEVKNINDLKVLLKDIFYQNPSYDSIFIKKTYASASGRNIFKLTRKELMEGTDSINEFCNDILRSEFLFQETIKQHPDLDILNPSSLNTIRFDTFIDKDGRIDIISGFLKMSTNNSYVDNNIAGGCGVSINLNTGKLQKFGYSKIKVSGVKLLTEHPVTKTKFEDLSIPCLPEAKEVVLKVAGLMPGLRLVGWDVGIGESGPVLIEGNSDYGINSNDLMFGGYLSNPTFRKVLDEINHR